MADLTGMRHGAVEELVPPRAADPRHTLRALVPLAHLLGYASSVRSTVREQVEQVEQVQQVHSR